MDKPDEKVFFDTAKQAYSPNPASTIDGFRLLKDTPTIDAYIRDNVIVIGVRGTKLTDTADLKADASLVLNMLPSTQRYKRDKEFVSNLVREYPASNHTYYLSGHSLGGAIQTQLKRDFPFLKDAVEFNPAFQAKDLTESPSDIKRIYTSTDFLYRLGGRFLSGTNVVEPRYSFGQGIVDGISGHVLDNFKKDYYSPVQQSGHGYGVLGRR
jgi:hypothetical protein